LKILAFFQPFLIKHEDYKYFYDPNDKEHFPKGFEHPAVKNLSKERIPFDKIIENLPAQE
jgi:hypothetical protein